MSPTVHSVRAREIRSRPPREWRHDVLERLAGGSRVLSLFGRRVAQDVTVTTLLRDGDSFDVLRTVLGADDGYHALTADVPALHCFERELHEATGLRIVDHPWLKPIRLPGGPPPVSDYSFYRLEGKQLHEVAVGPIHAGVIEPGSFRFTCSGERVHHLEIQLGYQHRGVQSRLLATEPTRLAPLVETIAGDSSVAHAWAYAAAVEELSGLPALGPEDLARAVALELERVAMHLAGLAGMAADIAFQPGSAAYGRLRTTAINATMRLCGSRFGRGAVKVGGGGLAIDGEVIERTVADVDLLRRDTAIVDDCFLHDRGVRDRLCGIGALSTLQALKLGLVGPAARSAGVPIDARHDAVTGVYRELPISRVVLADGDCWARAALRIDELDASLEWLARAVPALLAVERRAVPLELAADRLTFSIVEGWRGEVVHCLETGPDGRLVDYHVQDPSLRNWMGLALAVRDNQISDFPICNKSFDLSYCGNDL